MKLARKKVLDVLIKVLQEMQQEIHEEPEQITEDTIPIGDLYQFDSLASVAATVSTLVALGFKTDKFPSYPSLFINDQNGALTVGQVADRVLRLYK